MPLNSDDILKFLESSEDKFSSELSNLLLNRIHILCFDECQKDRISCTLSPSCTRRFLLKLRIKSDLTINDLPKFCYSVHKSVVLRDFRNKTVVYKPFDAYLYLIDFLDIFYHGDYRKLNKFISFNNWDEALKIFNERIKKKEDFRYILTDDNNYMIFKYGDKIHIVYIKQKYVLCNAFREDVVSLEILKGVCELYKKIYFPDFNMKLNLNSGLLEISTKIPRKILSSIKKDYNPEEEKNAMDHYFWDTFPDDLDALLKICKEVHLDIKKNERMEVRLCIGLTTNQVSKKKRNLPLKYKDIRLILNFVYKIYNEFYVIWVKKPEKLVEI